MEKLVLVMYVEGHASGRTEIMTFEDVMKTFGYTCEELQNLINTGDVSNGKCFDEAYDVRR